MGVTKKPALFWGYLSILLVSLALVTDIKDNIRVRPSEGVSNQTSLILENELIS